MAFDMLSNLFGHSFEPKRCLALSIFRVSPHLKTTIDSVTLNLTA